MNFLKKIVEHVAADEITDLVDIPIKIIEKASNKIGEIGDANQKKLFDVPSGTGVLAVSEHRYEWREKFDIYNKDREIVYTVKGELTSVKRNFNVYKANGFKSAK